MIIRTVEQRKGRNDDNLIPMINVVFLLLVFFMVAGTLRASDPEKLNPLESMQQRFLSGAIDVYVGSTGESIINGEIVDPLLLIETLRKVKANTGSQDIPLVVKVDSSLAIGELRVFIQAARLAGIDKIEVVTTPLEH